MKLNKQIFGWLGATALLLTTACANDMKLSGSEEQADLTGAYGTGNSLVTITLNSEAATSTRGYVDYAGDDHISNGTKATTLIFAVYEVKSGNASEVYVERTELSDINFPQTIRLAVDENNKYKIALWAQSPDAECFDTDDLTNVTVEYSGAKNNDELRDAFCANKEFPGNAKEVKVVLHRPFAQLNVGTTGADYNEYLGGNIYPNRKIEFSKVEVDGAYNTINILTDEISRSEDFEGKVTFDFDQIPALYGQTTPPEYFESAFSSSNGSRDEEFLVVKLNKDGENEALTSPDNIMGLVIDEDGFLSFKTTYPTMNGSGNYLTEKFRYLSMCYVLVPNAPAKDDNSMEGWPGSGNKYDENYSSSMLNKVTVYFAERYKATTEEGEMEEEESEEEEGDATPAPAYMNEKLYLTISNVPVHRNWRTNLLGGLNAPEDPNDPDDPSSLFANVRILVNLCPIYFDEYNGLYDPSDNNKWTPVGQNNGQGGFPGNGGNNLHEELNEDQN